MKGKRILLGITGGIAAYKIAFLIRLLKKSGAEVKCVMTPASSDFISPVVVSALSGNPVGIEFWNKSDGTWINHVEYGLWADIFVIAPLTANTMSKMANGSCDNLLLACYLSMKGKTMVAPSMDLDMYAHPAAKRNMQTLEKDGVIVIPAESGELASGLEGEGRMAEPQSIYDSIENYFGSPETIDSCLTNKRVLVTAGPTYEAIDPVRFIGNYSSGKMGYAIAESALKSGAQVTLISGPTSLDLCHPALKLIKVQSADEMFNEVKANWPGTDLGIFAAAVADYRPESKEVEKIKKSDTDPVIKLVKNPDIVKWAGENKSGRQVVVGFALETNDEEANALKKLQSKNLDMIVLNSLADKGAGFSGDTNKIRIFDKHNNSEQFELKQKSEVATDILNYITEFKP